MINYKKFKRWYSLVVNGVLPRELFTIVGKTNILLTVSQLPSSF